MKPYDIVITKKARQDILNTKYYIKYVLLSIQASETFEARILNKLSNISKNPYGYEEQHFGKFRYRKATVNKYIIAFRIDEQTHTVHIIAIGHSLQKRKNIVK